MGNQHGNGFGRKSTAQEVARDISLVGKNVIITGANTGLGKETARVMARMGAHVIIACRDLAKGAKAKEDIEAVVEGAQLTLLKLDLANLQSVEAFVKAFQEIQIPLHILICNAGIMALPYKETANGFEMQFGTNHLGHFHLTNLLLPKLIEGQPSRVVCLSSVAHKMSGIRFKDLSGKGTWYNDGISARWTAYGQSKTANLLFAVELNRRMHMAGHKITANAVHPGVIQTELMRDLGTVDGLFIALGAPFSKSIPEGSATTLYVATAPELEGIGGRYFADCNEDTPKPHASNPTYATKLWEISEEMIANAPTDEEFALQSQSSKEVQKGEDEAVTQEEEPQEEVEEESQEVEEVPVTQIDLNQPTGEAESSS